MSSIPLLLLLFIAYVCCENPLSADKLIGDGMGVATHITRPKEGEVKMIRDAGFKWIRQDFVWENTEKAKGVYNFSDYEYLVKQLEEHNMSAYFCLAYSNKLYEEHRSVVTEAGRKAYAKWAAAAVKQFKGKGFVWEIWNEPNVPKFWGNSPKVEQYAAMALEAAKAIKEVGSNEIVVGPATYDYKFTETCLEAGLSKYWDAISIHPYRHQEPETVVTQFGTLGGMIAKHEPKGKHIPIITGEWGYSAATDGEDHGFNIKSPVKQGKYIQRMMLHNAMHGVPVSIWYDWHNDGADAKGVEHNFGTVKFEYHEGKSPVYEPKEAYTAVKNMNTVLKGFKFEARLTTKEKDKDYVLLFRNEKKELRIAAWTTDESTAGHSITIPSDKCDFELIPNLGTPVKTASAEGGSFHLTINDAVHFIVPKCSENKALESAPHEKLLKV